MKTHSSIHRKAPMASLRENLTSGFLMLLRQARHLRPWVLFQKLLYNDSIAVTGFETCRIEHLYQESHLGQEAHTRPAAIPPAQKL